MNKGHRKRILMFMAEHPGEFTAEEIHDWIKDSGVKMFPSVKSIAGLLTRMPEVRNTGPLTWISAEVSQ